MLDSERKNPDERFGLRLCWSSSSWPRLLTTQEEPVRSGDTVEFLLQRNYLVDRFREVVDEIPEVRKRLLSGLPSWVGWRRRRQHRYLLHFDDLDWVCVNRVDEVTKRKK